MLIEVNKIIYKETSNQQTEELSELKLQKLFIPLLEHSPPYAFCPIHELEMTVRNRNY